MKYIGIVEDREVTPFVIVTYYEKYEYIEFPFVYDNEYQKKRYYSDERVSKRYFDRITKGLYDT